MLNIKELKAFVKKRHEDIISFSLLWTFALSVLLSFTNLHYAFKFILIFLPWILFLTVYFLPVVVLSAVVGYLMFPLIIPVIILSLFAVLAKYTHLDKMYKKFKSGKLDWARGFKRMPSVFIEELSNYWVLVIAILIGSVAYLQFVSTIYVYFGDFNGYLPIYVFQGVKAGIIGLILLFVARVFGRSFE